MDRLISSVYEAVLDQDRFDDLLALAEESLHSAHAKTEFAVQLKRAEAHFETAQKILSSLTTPERDTDRPQLRVGADLNVTDCNPYAAQLLGVEKGMALEACGLAPDSLRHLQAILSGQEADLPVLRIFDPQSGKPLLMSLRPVRSASGSREVELTGVDRVWHAGAIQAMQSIYGLTMSECDVLALLVNGLSPAEAAEARSRSVETLRQQIKSMVAKTHSSGTADLITLARAVAQSSSRRSGRYGGDSNAMRKQLRLKDGRVVDYVEQGDPAGKPVVFLHGCLGGNRLPVGADRELQAKGLRLIAPARPWHGQSSGKPAILDDASNYASDLAGVFDALNVRSVQLAAFDTGCIFALSSADRLQSYLSRIVCISAQPPMRSLQDFASAPAQQRLFALLPRISVPLLSYMAKLGDKRLKRDGPDGFAKTIYGGASADLTACEDREILDLHWQGHLFHVERGSDSFINDCRIVASNWADGLKKIPVPVQFVHGLHNQTIPPRRIKTFADLVGADLKLIDGAGHSLVFSHWRNWLDQLH